MRSFTRSVRRCALGALLGAALLVPAHRAAAGPISFDFNALSENASNSAVQTYMQGIVPGITVTGAMGLRSYTGDFHVVGPVDGNNKVHSVTLSSDPATDAFIANRSPTDRITMVFPFPIYSASFDFEIFPDGTGNWPDFTFKADGTTMSHVLGVLPGQSGTYPHSPDSGPNALEPVPQLLGSMSFSFPNGVTKLEFIDWPDRIAIDDLQVNSTPPPPPTLLAAAAPEPISLALWVGGLAGAAALGWRRRRRLIAV